MEFVFRNNLRTPITNIKGLIIFRDESGEPCDFKEVAWPIYQEVIKVPSLPDMKKGANIESVKEPVGEATIPAGLAKPSRVIVDPGTRLRAQKAVPEVRILGFDVAKNTD